jgi:hypothetical protein
MASLATPSATPADLYFGHLSLAFAIPGPLPVALCRWRSIYGTGERVGSLG